MLVASKRRAEGFLSIAPGEAVVLAVLLPPTDLAFCGTFALRTALPVPALLAKFDAERLPAVLDWARLVLAETEAARGVELPAPRGLPPPCRPVPLLEAAPPPLDGWVASPCARGTLARGAIGVEQAADFFEPNLRAL